MAEERIHTAPPGDERQVRSLLIPLLILVPALLLLLVVKLTVLLVAAGAITVLVLSLRRRYRLAILIGLLPFSHAGVGIEALPGFGVYDFYSLWYLGIVFTRWIYGGVTLRRLPSPILAASALVLVFIPSLLNSPPMFEFIKAMVQLIISVGTLVAVYAELQEEADGQFSLALLRLFAIEAAGVALYATYQTYTASSIITVLSGRVSAAFFEEVNYFAGYLLMAIPLAVAFLFVSRGGGRRILYGLTAAALAAGVIATVSRSGIAVLVLIALTYPFYFFIRGTRRIVAGLAIIVGFVGVVVVLLTSDLGSRFVDLFTLSRRFESFLSGRDTSLEQRQEILRIGFDMAAAHPIVGNGFGSFEQTFDSYKGSSLSTGFARSTHNTLLRTFAETGVVGLLGSLVFLGSLVGTVIRSFRRFPGERAHMMVFGLGLSLGSFLVMSLTLDQMFEQHFWVVAAVGISLFRKEGQGDLNESL